MLKPTCRGYPPAVAASSLMGPKASERDARRCGARDRERELQTADHSRWERLARAFRGTFACRSSQSTDLSPAVPWTEHAVLGAQNLFVVGSHGSAISRLVFTALTTSEDCDWPRESGARRCWKSTRALLYICASLENTFPTTEVYVQLITTSRRSSPLEMSREGDIRRSRPRDFLVMWR